MVNESIVEADSTNAGAGDQSLDHLTEEEVAALRREVRRQVDIAEYQELCDQMGVADPLLDELFLRSKVTI